MIARAFDDFAESADATGSWARLIAAEAARIEELLLSDMASDSSRRRGQADKRVRGELTAKEAVALASYEWILSREPILMQGHRRNYAKVHARLKIYVESGDFTQYADVGDIPSPGTWARYVRKGLSGNGNSRSMSARVGREHGSSIANSGDI